VEFQEKSGRKLLSTMPHVLGLVNFDGKIPNEITVEDKSLLEQVKLIAELEPEEKNMVFKMIDTFLTKKKFKDFFQKNIAAM